MDLSPYEGGKSTQPLHRLSVPRADYSRDWYSLIILSYGDYLISWALGDTWGAICQWSGAHISVMGPECFTLTTSWKTKTKTTNPKPSKTPSPYWSSSTGETERAARARGSPWAKILKRSQRFIFISLQEGISFLLNFYFYDKAFIYDIKRFCLF